MLKIIWYKKFQTCRQLEHDMLTIHEIFRKNNWGGQYIEIFCTHTSNVHILNRVILNLTKKNPKYLRTTNYLVVDFHDHWASLVQKWPLLLEYISTISEVSKIAKKLCGRYLWMLLQVEALPNNMHFALLIYIFFGN